MPFKRDVLQFTSIFISQIIFLIFAAYYLLQGAYIHSTILIGAMIPLFILMVLKGKKIKDRYTEEAQR